MKTTVVNLKYEEYDVYIGRAGKGQDGYFGNPFKIDKNTTRELAISKFEIYFYERLSKDDNFKNKILALKGKRLGCFCSPKPCHGDIIVDFLERENK